MSKVCVITGGGSGMCLAAAKYVDKDYHLVITGRTVAKLAGAKELLEALGHDVEAVACDVSNPDDVKKLVETACSLGEVVAVINGAGVSPSMGGAEYIFGINALGTINVNEGFATVLAEGGCIVDIASIAGYMLPEENYPVALYPLALSDPQAFAKNMQEIFSQTPEQEAGFYSYAVSKNFVAWYAKQLAIRLGKRGVRVLSVSPGVIDTPMVQAEGDSSSEDVAMMGVLGRMGTAEELGSLLAFLATGPATFVTAVDILSDGGYVTGMRAAQG